MIQIFRQVFLTIFALAVLGYTIQAQENRPVIRVESIEGPTPWSDLDVNDNDAQFQFAIVTDRTGGLRPGIFLDGVRKLNLLQPEFVVSVGDLIQGYTEDTVELNRQWKEFNGFIEELKMPFFYIPGNHDITNAVMEKTWKALFGPTYYHFIYKDVLFLCLNSEDELRGAGRGTINTPQYEYIKKVLDDNPDVRWTMVFMHQPLWLQENTRRWNDVEQLLSDRKHSVFVGHIHRYIKFDRNNGKYFTLATTGGGSSLRGPALGEFDHVVWVTMTKQGPVMANLMLDGIWDENVTTEAQSTFARTLADDMPIQISPLFSDQSTFAEEEIEIRITNDSDILMDVDLQFEASLDILPGFVKKKLTVQPNSVEILKTTLIALRTKPLGDFEPIALQADITYQAEEKIALNIQKNRRIKPEVTQNIQKSTKKITLDGMLNDWGELRLSSNEEYTETKPFDHKGKTDGSFSFDVSYDEKYLYVGIDVQDDEVLTDDKVWAGNQDGIYVQLDARTEKQSANGSGSREESILVGQNPKAKVNDKLFRPERLPEGTQAITKRTKKGYQTEMAIPLEYIKKMQGTDEWTGFRLNVSVRDYDQDFQHNTLLQWKPSWGSAENYIGSGTFRVVDAH